MAEPRVELIVQQIMSTLTGLPSSGANVERGRLYPWQDDVTHALTVSRGANTPTDEPNVSVQDSAINVEVIAHLRKGEWDMETELSRMAAEVYAAMMADHTQGLDYVIDTTWNGDGEPEYHGEIATPVARMVCTYQIKYRHSKFDQTA